MNRFGTIAQQHWSRWLPTRFASIENREEFFSKLGDEIELEVQQLEMALAGNDPPNEKGLEKLGRLNMARFNAEGQILREMALLEPEPGVEEDEEDEENQNRSYDPNEKQYQDEDREREREEEAKEDKG